MDLSAHIAQLQHHLKPYQLSHQDFQNRFHFLKDVEDPYVRTYYISNDSHHPSQRVAVRKYIADDQPKYLDVLQNLKSYTLLSDMECICKLVGFSFRSGQIDAAFEYNHKSFVQLMEERQFQEQRNQFYIFVFREILKISEQLREAGIQLQEIIPQALLLDKTHSQFKIKVLYDEREKRYEKIQEGIKVFASPEKIKQNILEYNQSEDQSNVSIDEPQNMDQQELVFQLGLFLLDLCYEYESSRSESGPFAKDMPLTRNSLSHKGYIVFTDNTTPVLNESLLDKKAEYLLRLQNSFISKMVELIRKMVVQPQIRIKLQELNDQVDVLVQLLKNKDSKQKENIQSTNSAPSNKQPETDTLYDDKLQDNLKKQASSYQQSYSTHNKQNIISQTTMTTTSLRVNSFDRLQPQDSPNIQKQFITIPRSRLLNQIKCHRDMQQKLQNFITMLEKRKKSINKQYYDKSEYFGQVDSTNFKRNGLGIYVYIQGDIYFGMWQENSLVQGIYLFKNGESFEGTVKSGKQGWGKYYYSNGNIYEGEWKNDLKNGKGKMTYPNGDVYEGMWVNGKKNGQGAYYYNNGTLYEGNFVNGKKSGFGVITFSNKTKIEAVWNQTHIEGPGKVYYSNGNYFQGNYIFSQKQGEGLYIWQDAQYYGGFEKDAMQGFAKIKFSENEYYEGKIKNGKRCGNGMYKYPNGDEFRGEWKNDQKIYGLYRFKDGPTFEGRFKLNNISYGVMVYENGESYEGEFKDGERHGSGTYRDVMKQVVLQGTWQKDQFISSF